MESNIKQNNPYLIVIRGPLGIGKSTVSQMLANILNADYISIDKVLEDTNLDTISEPEGCIPVSNFIEANKVILPEVLKSLRRGGRVVVDGNFYYKEALLHLIESTNEFPTHVFTLKCPLEICVERDSQRPVSHGYSEAKAVHKLVSRFDYGTCIDTEKETVDETLAEVLEHLPE